MYKEHLVKYFCHLALAHVQYNLYDNVFAFLCPISSLSPSSVLQRSRLGGSSEQAVGPGGEGALPALVAVSLRHGLRPCLSWPQSLLPENPICQWEVGAGMGGEAQTAPSHKDSSIVVIFRQNFVVFSLLRQILIKMQKRV